MSQYITYLNKIISVAGRVVSSGYGLLITVITAVLNFFRPEKFAFTVVLVAIVLDAVFGVWAAITQKKFVLSKLGRVTFMKISAYFGALIMLYMVEKLLHDSGFFGIKIAAAIAAACEFWSMSASILIIWPKAAFFRIVRRQLRGEIESKLGKPVDDILKD